MSVTHPGQQHDAKRTTAGGGAGPEARRASHKGAAEAFGFDPAQLLVPPLDCLDLPHLRAVMGAGDAELASASAGFSDRSRLSHHFRRRGGVTPVNSASPQETPK